LNFLVFKDRKPKEPGGYLNGYQLTAPFESFQKLGKQSGILYYVPAAYTSKIDPATGFIDLLKPKYESVPKSQEFFKKFDAIRYNLNEDYFEFAFRYINFTKVPNNYKNDWVVCTHGLRLRNKRNDQGHWETIEVDVTSDLKKLFKDNNIAFNDGKNILQDIVSCGKKDFFVQLIFSLRTTLAMRYSRTGEEVDYMLSPVKNPHGNFFDSRRAQSSMPQDADTNGAYHIALKGLMQLERIKNDGRASVLKKDEWFAYASQRIWG
jgi:CRISPR-associated protein Cpf1